VETFTIVTTDANEAVAQVHDRMPVILPVEAEETWLHGTAADACKLLTPYSGAVNLRAVSRHVSNVNNEGPECLDDAEPSWGSQQSLL
jgi:putative SOS response-associated peptidase YedK